MFVCLLIYVTTIFYLDKHKQTSLFIWNKTVLEQITKTLAEIKNDRSDSININADNYVNINVNNIDIVANSQEDIFVLDNETLLKVLRSGDNFPYVMTKELNCNPKFPQHQNIYISNLKNQEVTIYNGTDWEINKFRKAFKEIFYARQNDIYTLSNTQ